MNKYVLRVVIASLICTINLHSATSKTFFKPRPILQDNVLEKSMSLHRSHTLKSKVDFQIDNNFFYEQSTNKSDIKQYFFPDYKKSLAIKDAGASGTPDISADWLKIESSSFGDTFESKIRLSPVFRQCGVYTKLRKELDFVNKRLWVSANLPFVEIKTNANLREYDVLNQQYKTNTTSDANTNAAGALNNSLFLKYGKINKGTQRLAGLADIDFKFGYDFIQKEEKLFSFYGSLIIPTGYKPKCEYIFEPLIGNACHLGLGCGVHGDLNFFKDSENQLNILGNLDYHYLFKSTELRSFDLISNGPWSRYLLVFDQLTPGVVVSGINYFTKEMNITPRSTTNFLAAIHYKHKSFNFETGYNFWARECEKISLRNPWSENIGIASATSANIQSSATIATPRATSAEGFNAIPASNLNLNSARHQSACSHKIFAAVDLSGKWKDYPVAVDLGANYEFAPNNNVLAKWGLFLQLFFAI
ncbi:TPA: hypothetical protein DEO28_01815 [Candidatus Dependentiae bacterium]|nr:MAG: hypothetical protein UR14_C0004G0053 [candidate division TM6 bacterium GW2011_GWE2_31_21]KKP52971.1 MAG: hypothetical protein UR43_C0008G0053 [candidate division TM6 bacterium GW2011_GWF2_33_332]HBS47791.1 hypothetical protein [Candidatus Dependentiae bacterium]HBZ73233.1 hypothetical protein [Candidatus Dependentiae bacterium]